MEMVERAKPGAIMHGLEQLSSEQNIEILSSLGLELKAGVDASALV